METQYAIIEKAALVVTVKSFLIAFRASRFLNKKTVEREEVGEIRNKYFVLVFTKEKELMEDDLSEESIKFLSQVAIKKEEVLTIFQSIQKVTKMFDERKAIDIVYMDVNKAFDKIRYGRLVQKVKSHGIR
eukprot:g43623.t1